MATRRKGTSQGRAAEHVGGERKGRAKKNQETGIKKEQRELKNKSYGHWSDMEDTTIILALLIQRGPSQLRAESLKPMQWQKHYFKVCLFSDQLSNRRFGRSGLCLAPGGYLWLLHLSDCKVIQE